METFTENYNASYLVLLLKSKLLLNVGFSEAEIANIILVLIIHIASSNFQPPWKVLPPLKS